ncbi:hypothetical protein [Spiroplasma poulsonii]|nr:hypothetical protein [Spiroplasma poulsonii]
MLNLTWLVDSAFFLQNAIIVAKQLLGKYLIRIIDGKKNICKII